MSDFERTPFTSIGAFLHCGVAAFTSVEVEDLSTSVPPLAFTVCSCEQSLHTAAHSCTQLPDRQRHHFSTSSNGERHRRVCARTTSCQTVSEVFPLGVRGMTDPVCPPRGKHINCKPHHGNRAEAGPLVQSWRKEMPAFTALSAFSLGGLSLPPPHRGPYVNDEDNTSSANDLQTGRRVTEALRLSRYRHRSRSERQPALLPSPWPRRSGWTAVNR